MDGYELTVCTVTYKDRDYLELNMKLSKALNLNSRSIWIVIENDPSADDFMEASPPDLHVYEGYDMDYSVKRADSYHHAIALKKALRLAKTRFVLLLDPDFYIVRKNWITEIIEYMLTNDLAFFGAPYNPKWYKKFRYFPNLNCMIIDLNKVKKNTLDFRPGQDDYMLKENSLLLTKIIKRTRNRLLTELYNRRIIGSSQDAGYFVYHRHYNKKHIKIECVNPVLREISDLPRGLRKILYYLLPDRLSYIPKRKNYYSLSGFRELGYAGVGHYGWEEYLWKNKPFSIHMRKFQKEFFDDETALNNLVRVMNNLTGVELSTEI
jgi:hypothetical protein